MSLDNTPYINISCDLYDQLEAFAMKAIQLKIMIEDDSGVSTEVYTKIRDLQTKDKEEFAILENGQRVRLDRITSITPHLE